MTGGIQNGPILFGRAFTADSAITYEGTLLSISGENSVDLCAETGLPIGFAYTDTADQQTGVPQAGVKVAVVPLVQGMIVKIPRLVGSAALGVGDEVVPANGGTVQPFVAAVGAGARRIRVIGQVLEATAAGVALAGDMALVYVSIRDEYDRA